MILLGLLQKQQRNLTSISGKDGARLNRNLYVTSGLLCFKSLALRIILFKIICTSRLGHKYAPCLPLNQAFFNVILRHLGVAGIKVQEVFSLDDEMLNFLPLVRPGVVCDSEH
jgi:hypothetical protein